MSENEVTVPTKGRLVQIDALRGLAAIWVVLFHVTTRFNELYGHGEGFSIFIPGGRHGVHLFFMISGFVILMTLDKTGNVFDFAFNRFSRLFPTFWTCLLLTLSLVTIGGLPGREVGIKDFLANLTMMQEIMGFESIDHAYWSLEIELIFYAIMAACFLTLPRKAIIPSLLCLTVADSVLVTVAGHGDPMALPGIVKIARRLLDLRYIPLFVFGMLCYERSQAKKAWHAFALIACLACARAGTSWEHLAWITGCAALFFLATTRYIPVLHFKPLLFLGFISYPLYLVHQNISFVLMRSLYLLGATWPIVIPIAILNAVAIATVVSYRVERPVNERLRQWYISLNGLPKFSLAAGIRFFGKVFW